METNQPGLPGFRFSQTLSLIKVAMMANKEQEETISDDRYRTPPVEQYQPLALRERVKEELHDMEKRGVAIRKVEEPTDWVNSMLIVEKAHGSFRFCLDLRQRNKAKKGTLSATHY